MDDVFWMQVLNGQTDLNKNFPNEVFNQRSPILFSYVSIEVSVLTELLDNVDCRAIDERVDVPYAEEWVEFA